MERRNFFKILSTVSAGMAAASCGNKTDTLIPMLVSDREIVPGEEQWHPAVCGECGAGCGTIVRVMEGERLIERNGEKFRERVACIKKIEGNPLDPVSGGRLCARGQAAVQSLYNPDRVQGPLRRTGARGRAEFAPVSWDEAIASVTEKLAKARSSGPDKILFLARPQPGTRTANIQRFLASLGAPPPLTCSLASLTLERKAAELVFGWKGLPRYELAQARYAVGIGADFLGGWASPVLYARQFGHFRQGRPGIRGKLVQAESRMSITAQSADEWLPIRPGSEPHFALALARLLVDEKFSSQFRARGDSGVDLPSLIRTCGIEEKRLRRIARELGESEAPLIIAGASVIHTNSLDALIAAYYLNWLLGNVGKPGGIQEPTPEPTDRPQNKAVIDALKRAQILLLDGANPIYTLPHAAGVSQALSNIETIVSFGTFIDDSAAYADLILPDNHSLESVPLLRPLYNTRLVEQSLTRIAGKMNIPFAATTDQPQGGADSQSPAPRLVSTPAPPHEALFAGDPHQFPFLFQPYLSLQYHDGSGANLPWMQELPDPTSSAMWGLPLEIDPKTAASLNVNTGDWVHVESPHGSLEAPAYVHPAALPGVVSMAIGEGHSHYGRYASGRGTNPLSIVAPTFDSETGALAFGATRVRLARLNRAPGELIQFAPQDREQGPWGYR